MERNADDMFGATGNQSSATSGTSSVGSGGSGMAGNTAPPGGLDNSNTTSIPSGPSDQPFKTDRAAVQDKFGKVKDKAREIQSTLADKLDSGAEKLRQRNQTTALAGATDSSTVSVATEDRVTNVQESVARGMHKSADWLRNGDLKADIERQVRENPGRTLLIALGVGYLLGKAFKNNR